MNIIFIAPPAAGKGTQAKILCEKYGLLHISTGDLLRRATKDDLELQSKLRLGEFIDDSVIMELLQKKINSMKPGTGFVLDGFPRNINQAKALEGMLEEKPVVICIEVSEELAKNRILGRLYCNECGATYNDRILGNQPKVSNVCDNCQSNLIKRSDDTESTFKNRQKFYSNYTKPLLDYYRNQNVLYTVDGNQDTMKVHSDIVKVLEGEI